MRKLFIRNAVTTLLKEVEQNQYYRPKCSVTTSSAVVYSGSFAGLTVHAGRPAKRALQQSEERTRACVLCSDRKGRIFLMLCNANLQKRLFLVIYCHAINPQELCTGTFASVLPPLIFLMPPPCHQIHHFLDPPLTESKISVVFSFYLFVKTHLDMFAPLIMSKLMSSS